MARPLRVEFPGAVYHVTARGNERRPTFRDDLDRQQFLATLEQAVALFGLRLHAYCLMPNHYHLLVETPGGNLSRALAWLQSTYTIRFNRRHRRSGHLFQGRFKAHLVEADSYSMELLRYLHLNPVRPRDKTALVPPEKRASLRSYRWSSHRAYLGQVAPPAWLCTAWLSFFGRRRKEAQKEYARFVADAFGEVIESPWTRLQGGLALGGKHFVERVRALLETKAGSEELHWVAHADDDHGEKPEAGLVLARRQPERPWQVWVRVVLGGERRIDVARDLGYRDGSAVTQILKRLERAAQINPTLQRQMKHLTTQFQKALSSVKR